MSGNGPVELFRALISTQRKISNKAFLHIHLFKLAFLINFFYSYILFNTKYVLKRKNYMFLWHFIYIYIAREDLKTDI